MARRKVLFVSFNHPVIRPGGLETYALELYEAMRASDSFDPVLLARTGPPTSTTRRHHAGTPFTSINDDPGQYFIYTDHLDYDWLNVRLGNKTILTRSLRDFLLAHRPDVVHFQHTLFLGYDAIRVVRNTLPDAAIVYTLHEYLPICHRNGQMLRTVDDEICRESSPRRCHECFPEISPQSFFLRKRFIQSHLSLVDQFIAPSRYLLQRYVDWGIPRAKIRAEPYGRPAVARPAARGARVERNQFGFFGQLLLFKGINVLLRAVELAGRRFDGHIWIHGANLDLQPRDFQDEITALLERTRRNVTLVGPYQHAELGKLMERIDWVVVPSIWSENAPLVIDEAFQHGRPVICSDIGGMIEKVEDGRSGLHFQRGDPHDLGRVLARAAGETGLWEQLCAGIPDVYGMDRHLAALSDVYEGLLRERLAGVGANA